MSKKIDDLIKFLKEIEVKVEERNPDYSYCIDCDNIIGTEIQDDNAIWVGGEIWVCGKCMKEKIKDAW